MFRFSLVSILVAVSVCSAATTPSFPTGTFTAGPATILFNADGHFQVTAGNDSVQGSYTTSGDEISFTDASGTMACTKETATGQYKWSYMNNAITFKLVKDDCAERSGDITAQSWSKQ